MMYSLSLYPLVVKPTRITSISAALINNSFTNELRHHLTSDILINDISDHLPIFAIFANGFNNYFTNVAVNLAKIVLLRMCLFMIICGNDVMGVYF